MEKYELPLVFFTVLSQMSVRDGFGTDMAYAAW